MAPTANRQKISFSPARPRVIAVILFGNVAMSAYPPRNAEGIVPDAEHNANARFIHHLPPAGCVITYQR